MSTKKTKSVDLGALDGLGAIAPLAGFSDTDSYEHLLNGNGQIVSGKPLELKIDDVLEDEAQLRIKFDPEKMAEQRNSMKARIDEGKNPLITPISVKKHPLLDGKWLINDGARRYRNTKELNLKTISAIIDDAHDAYDQALANLQRDDNTAYELALFCKREVDAGKKPAYIAKRLGKDSSWVSKHLTIVDMPDAIMDAYNNEAISAVGAIYSLMKCYDKFKPQIDAVCAKAEKGELTRSEVARLITIWSNPVAASAPAQAETAPTAPASVQPQVSPAITEATTPAPAQAETAPTAPASVQPQASPAITEDTAPAPVQQQEPPAANENPKTPPTKVEAKEKPFKCEVIVSCDSRHGVMLFDKRPSKGNVWVIFDGEQEPEQVELSKVVIDELMEI